MVTPEQIEYLKYLYKIIFDEDSDNSREFSIFVKDLNPHPLRIKVEDFIYEGEAQTTNKFKVAFELDTFITNYIENDYENG